MFQIHHLNRNRKSHTSAAPFVFNDPTNASDSHFRRNSLRSPKVAWSEDSIFLRFRNRFKMSKPVLSSEERMA